MKVKELIEELQKLPEDHDVVVSVDSEGNEFGPFGGLSTAMYVPETKWCGWLRDADYDDDPDDPYKENAVVIWPTN